MIVNKNGTGLYENNYLINREINIFCFIPGIHQQYGHSKIVS
jgi:hypothetical protein